MYTFICKLTGIRFAKKNSEWAHVGVKTFKWKSRAVQEQFYEKNLEKKTLGFSALFTPASLAPHLLSLKDAQNVQVVASLLTSCNRLVINKPISGCVRMSRDSLLTTSLLQVVDRLVASCLSKLVITGLLQVVSTSCNKSANDTLQQVTYAHFLPGRRGERLSRRLVKSLFPLLRRLKW